MSDHVHILISIPPNYAVSQVVGYIKGKSAIHLARTYGEHLAKFPANCKMCQGTTLVVPEEQQNLVGLSPCSFVFSYLQFRSF